MRWSYKTVHFELKKDGLLGGAFLDDTEIEETLNEFGRGGWELVSMFETRDGVIAVFKQPLELNYSRSPVVQSVKEKHKSAIITHDSMVDQESEPEQEGGLEAETEPEREGSYQEDEEYSVINNRDEEDEPIIEEEPEDQDNGVGSIRIE